MIVVKSERELNIMREAGKIVQAVFDLMQEMIAVGVTTKALDQAAETLIRRFNALPSFKGYGGFPASLCTSVNDTLIHGIPSDYRLKDGDIISIDVGVQFQGYHADAARTYLVGNVDDKIKKLVAVTEESFFKAMDVIRPGAYVGDISHTIQTYVERHGYSLPEEYTGHGVGQTLHEDPQVPNWGRPHTGPMLKKGMTLAIEPMVNLGKKKTRVLKDEWTVKTVDGQWCAHYENTIIVTDSGVEIITLKQGG
jgi:methionyl aminopeptidase